MDTLADTFLLCRCTAILLAFLGMFMRWDSKITLLTRVYHDYILLLPFILTSWDFGMGYDVLYNI